MKRTVTSQAELDAAIEAGDTPEIQNDATYDISKAAVVRISDSSQPRVVASGSSQPRVEASGSSQPRVVASGSSQPRVEAYDSSQPRVEAYDSSQPRVEAYGSSQPRVVASGSSQPRVVASGSSQPRVVAKGFAQLSVSGAGAQVTAGPNVSVLLQNGVTAKGGRQVVAERPFTDAATWCDYYGVEVKDGVAILYKAVEADWRGEHKKAVTYEPGSVPVAPDWDGGEQECGGGLHFSPRPPMALRFCATAEHYLACPVALVDISVHPGGSYPEKCKARGACAPIFEVSIDGEPLAPPATSTDQPKTKRSRAKKGAVIAQ